MNESLITIRRAVNADAGEINRLLFQVNGVHNQIRPDLFKMGGKKYTDEELQGIIEDDNTPIFVALEGDKLLGYCFCIFQQHIGHNILTDIRTLYIDDLCVDEACRGKHVGTLLYEHTKQFAKDSGCYNVTLNVWAGNDSAKAFYEKCGLKPQKYGMEEIL